MTPFEIGIVSLFGMGLLVFLGMYISIALTVISFLGVWAIRGSFDISALLLAMAVNDTLSNYYFGVIPLFVFMGFIVSETGIGKDAYDVANAGFRRLRGGLGVGTVGANAIFAAITGISIASAAVFTRIAVPQMLRHGYTPRFAVGVVAGSSVLGMLIPPSLLLILYGILTEQSIGHLFIAGVLPGMLLAFMFGLFIVLSAYFMPQRIQPHTSTVRFDAFSRTELCYKGIPICILIAFVFGGIYVGWFTPVEAAAMGAIGALVMGIIKRRLTLRGFWHILLETGAVTASVCFLLIAAQMYSKMLAFSGLPMQFGAIATDANLGFWGIIAIYILVTIFLGMILDSSSILLILVPLILPVLQPYGVDLIWFGIITIIAVEIGLLTPPFGLSVYVIKSTLNDPSISLKDIFIGALPFAFIMLVTLLILLAFPAITTALL